MKPARREKAAALYKAKLQHIAAMPFSVLNAWVDRHCFGVPSKVGVKKQRIRNEFARWTPSYPEPSEDIDEYYKMRVAAMPLLRTRRYVAR